MITNIIFLGVSYVAAIVATIAGFGSSTVLIPVAMMFMDPQSAILLVACFHLFSNVFKIHAFWRKIDVRTCLLFGIPSIICAFIGALLITALPVRMIKIVVAIFLLVFAVYSIVRPQFSFKKSNTNAFLGGGISGLLAGLIGLGGALRSTFLVAFDLPKEIYIATGAMIAFVVDVTRIPTYIYSQSVEKNMYFILIPFLIVSAYLGVQTGKTLVGNINQKLFRQIVLSVIVLIALKLFF